MSATGAPINVTKTFLPPWAEYQAWLEKAYASSILTNNGPIHRQLEEALQRRTGQPFLRLMANGTLALQLALRALEVRGKVITTPYSYVATLSALLWEGCTPVFADVLPDTCCIDPEAVERAVDEDTTAILATHVYGIPCDVEALEAIAHKHGLKVIYDAAHAFDVCYKGKGILSFGDASILSFHATKLFHTVEGGAVVLHDAQADERLRLLRSFGHIGDEHFTLGMNAKMSEVHAAMGMAMLPHVEGIIKERARVIARYDAVMRSLGVERPRIPEGIVYNNAYYPVFLRDGEVRETVLAHMAQQGINTRRYFFPALNRLPYVPNVPMPVSERRADQVLCLPLYAGLTEAELDRIILAFEEGLKRCAR